MLKAKSPYNKNFYFISIRNFETTYFIGMYAFESFEENNS